MRPRSWALAYLIFALGCGGSKGTVAEPKRPPAPKTPADVTRGVSGALEQYKQALQVRSLEALEALWVQTPDAALTHQGKTHRGWEQVRPYLKALMRDNTEIRMVFSQVRITVLGDAGATVTASLRRGLGDGTTLVEESGTLSLALRRQQSGWVIVTEHFSYPRRTE